MTLVTQEDSDFTNIFRSSKNGFIQFAYSYLGNMQDAEDVVMESYIQYWENKDKATFQTSNIKKCEPKVFNLTTGTAKHLPRNEKQAVRTHMDVCRPCLFFPRGMVTL